MHHLLGFAETCMFDILHGDTMNACASFLSGSVNRTQHTSQGYANRLPRRRFFNTRTRLCCAHRLRSHLRCFLRLRSHLHHVLRCLLLRSHPRRVVRCIRLLRSHLHMALRCLRFLPLQLHLVLRSLRPHGLSLRRSHLVC